MKQEAKVLNFFYGSEEDGRSEHIFGCITGLSKCTFGARISTNGRLLGSGARLGSDTLTTAAGTPTPIIKSHTSNILSSSYMGVQV